MCINLNLDNSIHSPRYLPCATLWSVLYTVQCSKNSSGWPDPHVYLLSVMSEITGKVQSLWGLCAKSIQVKTNFESWGTIVQLGLNLSWTLELVSTTIHQPQTFKPVLGGSDLICRILHSTLIPYALERLGRLKLYVKSKVFPSWTLQIWVLSPMFTYIIKCVKNIISLITWQSGKRNVCDLLTW